MKKSSCNLLLSDYRPDCMGRVYNVEMFNSLVARYIQEEGHRRILELAKSFDINITDDINELMHISISSRKERNYSAQEFFYDTSFKDY